MTSPVSVLLLSAIAFSVAGCSSSNGPAAADGSPATLRIGYGTTAGTRIEQVADNITTEALVILGADGRPTPVLAETWSVSDDGLSWRFKLRSGVRFHDGTPVTAEAARAIVARSLPPMLGPSFDDIKSIDAVSQDELVFTLNRRLAVLPETLTMPIRPPGSRAGTGPFQEIPPAEPRPAVQGGARTIELRANDTYRAGRPPIDRIQIEPYRSVRSAWADLLRDRVDMIYEVGVDAFDLIAPAQNTKMFAFQRAYSYLVVLNIRRPALKSASVRRALNGAVNREEIVANGLNGHGRIADGPMWPENWANDQSRPRFQYEPALAASQPPFVFTCMYSDPTDERVALLLQRQLQAVGVNVTLELTTVEEGTRRANAGDFDAWLVDMGLGTAFFRQQVFWQSGSQFNWGGYANADVDAAFDRIRRSASDDDYKAGIASFQRAIADDPPAIFLAWNERARAITTRFEVPVEPGRDVLKTLPQWRLMERPLMATRH